MKTIFLIPSINLPIPCVKGGAVEQLITYLLEENERFGNARLIVLSKYDEDAAKRKYNNSSIYYFDTDSYDCDSAKGFEFCWKVYKLWCKLAKNSLVRKLFPRAEEPLGKYHYLCRYIAKKERVDAISIEGQWEEPFVFLNKLVGKENLYAHLHAVREENLSLRKQLPNSISISQYVKDQWVRDKSISGKNHVLINAADTEAFDIAITQDKRNNLRKKLGVAENELLLLFCGRMVKIKGIQELLEAFELLSDIPAKLLLIGSAAFGNSRNTDFEDEINQRISNNKRIIHLGFVHNHELPDIYALADIQIIPTICQEGAGLVAIEGMAAGLPLITTISGGMVEYVTDETAIQLPIDENLPRNIANTVIELYNNPGKRKTMSQSGKARAQLFSKEIYYKNFIKIFDI